MDGKKKKQQNVLLTFSGEQDATAFGWVVASVAEHNEDETGGSREISVRAEGNHIVIGYKQELTV